MRQFLLFLLTGGLAAGLNWASRFLFSLWMPFDWAIVAAFFVGLTTGFVLMRRYVFDTRGQALGPQVWKYLFVNLLALAQTLIVSLAMAEWVLPALGVTWNVHAIAHLAGVGFPIITSFFGHRMLTFR